MHRDHRHKLRFGLHATPRFKLDGKAVCCDRGDVIVCGLFDSQIARLIACMILLGDRFGGHDNSTFTCSLDTEPS